MADNRFKKWLYHQLSTDFTDNMKTRSIYYVYICCFTANLLLITLGSCLSWAAPVLPKLLSNDTNINPFEKPISTVEVAIIASCQFVGVAGGFIIMAKVSNWIGRKRTMRYSGLSIVSMLFVLAFAKSMYIYIISLIILGFNISGIYISVSVYNIEISEISNRTKIGLILGMAAPTGIFITYIIGAYTSVKLYTLIIAIPAVIHLILEPFVIVESPIYLASKGKDNEALSALKLLRNTKTNEEIMIEYAQIENFVQGTRKQSSLLDMFKTRASRKALFLSLLLCVGQQTCGISTLLTFSALIFNYSNSGMSTDTIGIIIGGAQLMVYFVVGYLYNRFGARKLILFSSSFCSFCMLVSSILFYLIQIQSSLTENLGWLPIVLTVLFIIGYGIGYGFIPISLCNELFTTDLRSLGFGTSMVGESIVIFIVRFSYPFLSINVGEYLAMFVYFIAGLFNFFVFFFLLPDTKDKTFEEIQIELSK
ncbi:probable metabolite transport protein CsbC [Diabrotica undecimpunctata]|uniref:probable metabolite transport protein CsbC n=1 Tax=Diabrotica undecimpunctata TaxID=50387 RepID=UPI003B63879E